MRHPVYALVTAVMLVPFLSMGYGFVMLGYRLLVVDGAMLLGVLALLCGLAFAIPVRKLLRGDERAF
jgi:hypothetical protein